MGVMDLASQQDRDKRCPEVSERGKTWEVNRGQQERAESGAWS